MEDAEITNSNVMMTFAYQAKGNVMEFAIVATVAMNKIAVSILFLNAFNYHHLFSYKKAQTNHAFNSQDNSVSFTLFPSGLLLYTLTWILNNHTAHALNNSLSLTLTLFVAQHTYTARHTAHTHFLIKSKDIVRIPNFYVSSI